MKYHQEFVDKYPNSRFIKDSEKMYEESQKEIDRLVKVEQDREKEKERLKNADPNRPAKVTAANQ